MEPTNSPERPTAPVPPDRQDAAPATSSVPSDPNAPLDVRRRRILFRATHRGTQETDRLIGGFVSPRIAGFTEDELDQLEEVMELQDVDLADWLMGRRPIPPDADTPMLRAIEAAALGGDMIGVAR